MNAAQIVKRNRAARTKLRSNIARELTAYTARNLVDHEALAVSLGCSASQTYRLVAGTRTPEAIMVSRIAKLCGTTVEKIMNGDGK